MSFGTPVAVGSAQTKTSGTGLTMQTTADVPVGDLCIVRTTWDNTDTADGDTGRLDIADESGNAWVKLCEHTRSSGAAADGCTLAVFASVIETQIDSGDDITVTSDTSRAAKTMVAEKVPIDEADIALEDLICDPGSDAADPPAISLSSLTSREYLMLYAFGGETAAPSAFTQDADYSALSTIATAGGGGATNVYTHGGYRIATLTGDSVDPTVNPDADHVQALLAIYEVAGGGPTLLSLSGETTPVGALQKSISKPLGGSSSPSGGLVKSISKPLAGVVSPAGALAKLASKLLAGVTSPAGALTSQVVKVLALAGAISPGGALAKLTDKRAAGTTAPQGTVSKAVSKSTAGEITPSGALRKLVTKLTGGAVSPSGSLLAQLVGAVTVVVRRFDAPRPFGRSSSSPRSGRFDPPGPHDTPSP